MVTISTQRLTDIALVLRRRAGRSRSFAWVAWGLATQWRATFIGWANPGVMVTGINSSSLTDLALVRQEGWGSRSRPQGWEADTNGVAPTFIGLGQYLGVVVTGDTLTRPSAVTAVRPRADEASAATEVGDSISRNQNLGRGRGIVGANTGRPGAGDDGSDRRWSQVRYWPAARCHTPFGSHAVACHGPTSGFRGGSVVGCTPHRQSSSAHGWGSTGTGRACDRGPAQQLNCNQRPAECFCIFASRSSRGGYAQTTAPPRLPASPTATPLSGS